MHTLVPLLGGLLSGQREYRYLPNSIRAFPPPADFERMLSEAGLCRVRSRALTFGVCQLYVAEVP
jgi:demethylmenaquinone methyltransferase/2-methoxy-6-polyprenyl-1,4-benzoquinol methylase